MNNETNDKASVQINGSIIEDQMLSFGRYQSKQTIKLSATRGQDSKNTIAQEKQILLVEFDDSSEWISVGGNVAEIFGEENAETRSGKDLWTLPVSLQEDSNRSGFGGRLVKYLHFFDSQAADFVADKIVEVADKKLMPAPGLYKMGINFEKLNCDPATLTNGKCLLLLHGTFSSTEGSFSALNGNVWQQIYTQYAHVIAYDHYTLSLSPYENALDLLKLLPQEIELDIMAYSRGGLVADVLCRLDDKSNLIFTNEEIQLVESEDDKKQADTLRELNTLANTKNISIQRLVRVACPAAGTPAGQAPVPR